MRSNMAGTYIYSWITHFIYLRFFKFFFLKPLFFWLIIIVSVQIHFNPKHFKIPENNFLNHCLHFWKIMDIVITFNPFWFYKLLQTRWQNICGQLTITYSLNGQLYMDTLHMIVFRCFHCRLLIMLQRLWKILACSSMTINLCKTLVSKRHDLLSLVWRTLAGLHGTLIYTLLDFGMNTTSIQHHTFRKCWIIAAFQSTSRETFAQREWLPAASCPSSLNWKIERIQFHFFLVS